MSDKETARGAISTSHTLATEAGAEALRAGGNALDAALAAAATLCVVYPNNVALGGDLVALVRSPDGEVHFLNATGPSPKDQSLEALRAAHGTALPLRHIDTVTVPGGICGWNSLHELGAKLPWGQHFTRAIEHAETGFPNARSVAAELAENRSAFESDPGMRQIFYPDGEPLREGERLRQPALAASLKALAAGGSEEFYEGELAKRWIEGLRRLGSKISLDDARDYSAEYAPALEGDYGEHRVITGPPNSSGFMMLRSLRAIAERLDDPLVSQAGQLARIFDECNAIRARHLADPRFGSISGDELIVVARTEAELPDAGGAEKPTGDTVGLSAVSADGWAISLINSVYYGFGAGILEPETGIIFQNRGTSFSLDAASPNVFAPGKRPRHTLMPVLVLRGDELAWVPATMGGSAQPQIHTQLLLRVLAGETPHEATHAPRWIVEEPDAQGRTRILVESDVAPETRAALIESGYELHSVPPWTEDLGHSNLIEVSDAGYTAASDPRSDGSAIVVRGDGTFDEARAQRASSA